MQENYDLFNSWKRWWLNKCFCANWMIYNKTYFSSKYWIKSVIESSFQCLFLRDLLYDFAVDYIFQDTINCYITLLCMQGIKNLFIEYVEMKFIKQWIYSVPTTMCPFTIHTRKRFLLIYIRSLFYFITGNLKANFLFQAEKLPLKWPRYSQVNISIFVS